MTSVSPPAKHCAESMSVAVGGRPEGRPLGEESFRRVVEYSPSAMIMVDGEGVIVLANAQAEAMFGFPREQLIGRRVEMLVPERFRAAHGFYRRDFGADPVPRPMGHGRDLYAVRADGSEFPVEIGLNPIKTEAGLMVLASVVDNTERLRAQRTLERALQEKTVLLNEVHHRVKNNLQVISSLLNLQAGTASHPKVREILEESQSRIRAMALTHQLLYERKDFSHVDLVEYLSRLAQSLYVSYRPGERVRLRVDMPPGRLEVAFEKAIPCGLAVNELVSNAFKHAFPSERTGLVAVTARERPPEDVEVEVSDDGIGLPTGFDLNNVKSLGLQLVPLLADQLGGELIIEPKTDGGTAFRLRFPNIRSARQW